MFFGIYVLIRVHLVHVSSCYDTDTWLQAEPQACFFANQIKLLCFGWAGKGRRSISLVYLQDKMQMKNSQY